MIGALIGAGAGILQTFLGGGQNRRARKMERQNVRPDMPIPDEVLSVTRRAKTMSNQGLSRDTYGNALNNIWRGGAAALRGSQDRRSGMSMISTIQQGQNDAALKLDIADNEKKEQNRMYADRMELNLGDWKHRQWDWNKRQSYLEKADAIRALRGAGQRNMNAGLNGILTGGLMAYQGGAFGKGANEPTYLGSDYGYVGGLPGRTPRRRPQDWTNYPED